jgi:hypothetical protein
MCQPGVPDPIVSDGSSSADGWKHEVEVALVLVVGVAAPLGRVPASSPRRSG